MRFASRAIRALSKKPGLPWDSPRPAHLFASLPLSVQTAGNVNWRCSGAVTHSRSRYLLAHRVSGDLAAFAAAPKVCLSPAISPFHAECVHVTVSSCRFLATDRRMGELPRPSRKPTTPRTIPDRKPPPAPLAHSLSGSQTTTERPSLGVSSAPLSCVMRARAVS
jgi:hypothetical protein